jgi:hypothetical protein
MTHNTFDYGVAASAITSSFWIQLFDGANTILATILTILGIILTLIKIMQHLEKEATKRD